MPGSTPGLKQIQIEFENSSKHSDQIVREETSQNEEEESKESKGGARANVLDRLLSERDSQFSNFNEKI